MTVALSKKISEGERLGISWHSTLPFAKETAPPLVWDTATSSWVLNTASADAKELLDAGFPTLVADGEASLRQRFSHELNLKDDFGAVMDGVADDSPAERAMILRAHELIAAGAPGVDLVYPPGICRRGGAAEIPPITRRMRLRGAGPQTTSIYIDDGTGNAQFFWVGDEANDPPEGGNPGQGTRPDNVVIEAMGWRCLNDLWGASTKMGPYSGAETEWEVTFPRAVNERFEVMMIVDGAPYAVDLYHVEGFGSDTLTWMTVFPPGAVVWFFLSPEKSVALQNQGTARTHVRHLLVRDVPTFARDGWRQRNNGTKYQSVDCTFYCYRYPGCQVLPGSLQQEEQEDGEPYERPRPAFITVTPNESVDGSRTTFTFTLPTPPLGTTQLLGEEILSYVEVDGAASVPAGSSSGWGTGTITVVRPVAPTASIRLIHYTLPIGLPNSFYISKNSGPTWMESCQWVGRGADHSGGGAFYEFSPDNGYTPAPATLGGATGDTRLWQFNTCQAFWSPFAASVGWDGVPPAEAVDGTEDTFTFTFSQAVQPGTFALFVDGVNWRTDPANDMTVTGYGTTTITAVLSPAPDSGAVLDGRRRYAVMPKGKPYGMYIDYTRAHPSNFFTNGSVMDHTTVAGIYIRSEPDVPGEHRSFTRQLYFNDYRIAADRGPAILVEAYSSGACASIHVSRLKTWARRDDPQVVLKGNYEAVSFDDCFFGELGSSVFFPDRPPPIQVYGRMPKINGCFGGKFVGRIDQPTRTIPDAVIQVHNPYITEYSVTGCAFPANSQAYAKLIRHPTFVARQVLLDEDPLLIREYDSDGDGEVDTLNPNVRIVVPRGLLRVGQVFTLSGAAGGKGLSADFLNDTWTVYTITGAGYVVIQSAKKIREGEGGDQVTSSGAFGGDACVITIEQDGYIRHEAAGEDLLSVSAGSDLVTLKTEGHNSRPGEIVLPTVQSGGGGLTAGQVSGPREVVSIIDPDHVTYRADTAASTSSSDFGGDVTVEFWEAPEANRNRVESGNTPGQPNLTVQDIASGISQSFRVSPELLAAVENETELADASTIVPDFGLRTRHRYAIDGNRAMGKPINIRPGREHIIIFRQAGGGSNNIASWDAWYSFLGASPTLATGTNAKTYIGVKVSEDGTQADCWVMAPITATFTGGVPSTRNLTAGNGLTGGGDLSADRSFAIDAPLLVSYGGTGRTSGTAGYYARWNDTSALAVVSPAGVLSDIGGVGTSRTITAGSGLTGGGDLSANRTLAIDAPLGVNIGGTGLTTITSGRYLQGNGTSAPTLLTGAQVLSDIGGVPTSRSVSGSGGLTGGGALTGDLTISIDGTVSPSRGGTGIANPTAGRYLQGNGTSAMTLLTAAQVLSDIGAAAAVHNHSASDITSGTLAVANGGTGRSSGNAGSYARWDGTSLIQAVTPSGVLTDIGGVPTTRTVSAGTGLTGGGDLSSNRTISLDTPVTVARGGSGLTTATSGYFLQGAGTSAFALRSPAQTSADINAWFTLTDAATVTMNLANGNALEFSTANNRAIGAPSNATAGQVIVMLIKNTSAGIRSMTFNAAYILADGVANPVAIASGKTQEFFLRVNSAGTVLVELGQVYTI